MVKSVWQNWDTGLDFRTRTDRAHCILGNIINTTCDAILTCGYQDSCPVSNNAFGSIFDSFLFSSSSLLSLHVSLSHTVFMLDRVTKVFTLKDRCRRPQLKERDRK